MYIAILFDDVVQLKQENKALNIMFDQTITFFLCSTQNPQFLRNS